MEELQHKREQLKQEVVAHLNNMKNELAENQKRAEEFDREFLKGQTDVLNAVNDFNTGNK